MRGESHDASRSRTGPVAATMMQARCRPARARLKEVFMRGIFTAALLMTLLIGPDIAIAQHSHLPDAVQGCGHDDLQGTVVGRCLNAGLSILCTPNGARYCCKNKTDGSVDSGSCRMIPKKAVQDLVPGQGPPRPLSSPIGKPRTPQQGTPRPLSNPKTPTKPQGPGSVGTPPKSNPTAGVKPKGPGSVGSPPKSNSSSGGGGTILRSGNSGNSNSNKSGGGGNSGGSKR